MSLNILDYIILAILILSVLAGLRKGFIKALGGIVSVLLAIILAAVFYDDIAVYLEDYYGINTMLADFIRTKLPVSAISMDGIIPVQLAGSIQVNDVTGYLAFLFLIAVTFILVVVIGSKLIQLLWNLLDEVFSWGVLSWINKGLGMVFVVIKNFLIMAVILGVVSPIIEMGAGLGWTGAIVSLRYISDSAMAGIMLESFAILKTLLGINV